MVKPLTIEGTTLEGGGQLVRLSVGLAALTGRHIKITNIRGGRGGGGGLKRQHLIAVEWLAEACNARMEGAELGSRRLDFEPDASTNRKRKFRETTATLADGTIARAIAIDLGSPGAVTLVLQAIFPYILLSTPSPSDCQPKPVLLTLHGGTNCSASPSLDYIEQVTIPNLILAGLPSDCITLSGKTRRGFTHGSASVGNASFLIQPLRAGCTISPLKIPTSRGRMKEMTAILLAPSGFARSHLQETLSSAIGQRYEDIPFKLGVEEDSRHWRRYYALLVVHTSSGFRLGIDCLHEGKVLKGDDGAREVVESMISKLMDGLEEELGHQGPLDRWMQDQIVIFQGLAAGRSGGEGPIEDERTTSEPTLHTRTAKWAVAKLLPGAFFDEDYDACDGVGPTAGEQRHMSTRKQDEDISTELAQLNLRST